MGHLHAFLLVLGFVAQVGANIAFFAFVVPPVGPHTALIAFVPQLSVPCVTCSGAGAVVIVVVGTVAGQGLQIGCYLHGLLQGLGLCGSYHGTELEGETTDVALCSCKLVQVGTRFATQFGETGVELR